MAYSDNSIIYLRELKEQGLSWEEIADEWNDRYEEEVGKKTANALRKAFKHYEGQDLSDDALLKNMKTTHTAKKTSSKLRKENKVLLDNQIIMDDINKALEAIEKFKVGKVKIPKPAKSAHKKKMTIEALISDTHYGLQTKSFNADVARSRMQQYTATFLAEADRYSKNYNVEVFNILLNGDIIQSATMHKDSEKSSHLTNAQQLAVATESLFFDFLLPIAKTGKVVNVIGTGGNHDREDSQRSTVDPGTSYYTFTIYKALENLCRAAGLANVEIDIPEAAYRIYEIYGSHFLVEHGDLMKNNSSNTIENHLMRRSAQADIILQGIRFGHYHTDRIEYLGRFIGNGSLVSDDHYSDGLGYTNRPCQVINFYVETENRDTSYYHSFAVYLD
jgi:hypothetical protein